jgi:nucleotide-binding universal stress UspA family protein
MSIVVGVDGSESALRATRWAAREAARRSLAVRLVHVRQLPLLLPLEDMYAQELTEQGRKWLSAARDHARDTAPGIDVRTELRTGQPSEELVTESEHARLVVVGSRGLGGFRSLLLGSVANALAAHAHCPVIVLRGRTVGAPPPEQGPIVVGADGTPAGADAVEFALATADRGAEVIAVHAWNYETIVDVWSPAVDWDEVAAAQYRTFDEQLGKWRAGYPNVLLRGVHYRGRPVDGILGQAEHAQLVVVGAGGHHPALAGAIGSTSYAVLHHATCPVAVVRSR